MTRRILKNRAPQQVKRTQFSLCSSTCISRQFIIYINLSIKYGLITSLLFFLVACNNQIEDLFGAVDDAVPDVNFDHYISLDDISMSFKSIDGNDVYIRSNRSTIIILSGSVLGNVLVEGHNCSITFEDPVSIRSLDIRGSDNVINVSVNSGITINSDTGSGNILITY